jgi:hypothetical protein
MKKPSDAKPSPVGLAFEWVARILAVSAEMVLPGLAGQWLDSRWGTQFLVLVGFGLGILLGITHLIVMTSARSGRSHVKEVDRSNERRK